jgi:hypothetical protein
VGGFWGGPSSPEANDAWASIKQELGEVGRLFASYGGEAMTNPDKLRRIGEVLRRTRSEIELILKDTGPVTQ